MLKSNIIWSDGRAVIFFGIYLESLWPEPAEIGSITNGQFIIDGFGLEKVSWRFCGRLNVVCPQTIEGGECHRAFCTPKRGLSIGSSNCCEMDAPTSSWTTQIFCRLYFTIIWIDVAEIGLLASSFARQMHSRQLFHWWEGKGASHLWGRRSAARGSLIIDRLALSLQDMSLGRYVNKSIFVTENAGWSCSKFSCGNNCQWVNATSIQINYVSDHHV